MPERLLLTGAAGFIGSNLARHLLEASGEVELVALDALTYSGSSASIEDLIDDPRFTFVHADICDREVVRGVFEDLRPNGIFHLAAESHVDRSIEDPLKFVRTNVEGTVVLLQEAMRAWGSDRGNRFLHVSTDEVFGELGPDGLFDEMTPYAPNSPYSASKAASDHFVRAWGHTYGINYVITNCTNNYGPYQFPEKLIPVVITRALAGEPIPVYGDGTNVRDWLYVGDHCRALSLVYEKGTAGETYCIGGESEVDNLSLVRTVLSAIDELRGSPAGTSQGLIEFVPDRPGHDLRYAMDIEKIRGELGWKPEKSLREGIRDTVEWYLTNQEWLEQVRNEEHHRFQREWYGR